VNFAWTSVEWYNPSPEDDEIHRRWDKMLELLIISELISIPAADLSWSATCSGGPGGQNVNKVASKVILRFFLDGNTTLSTCAKKRLRSLAGSRLTDAGEILITSQSGPDQRKNLDDAREKLRHLILRALNPPKPRRPTRPTLASKTRRLDSKRLHSVIKLGRKPAPMDD